jgi:hypothetical protein
MSLLLLAVILLMGLLVVALFIIAALLDRPWNAPFRQPGPRVSSDPRMTQNKAA